MKDKKKVIVFPDSKVHGANMGPTWVLTAPDGPHVGPMNLAIRVVICNFVAVISTMCIRCCRQGRHETVRMITCYAAPLVMYFINL